MYSSVIRVINLHNSRQQYKETAPTCAFVVAGLVHLTFKQLQPHYSIKGDHEEDKQSDVKQRQYSFQNRVHNHLQACRGATSSDKCLHIGFKLEQHGIVGYPVLTWNSRDKTKWSEDTKGSKSFHIKPSSFLFGESSYDVNYQGKEPENSKKIRLL